jgi:hypothetical protein
VVGVVVVIVNDDVVVHAGLPRYTVRAHDRSPWRRP